MSKPPLKDLRLGPLEYGLIALQSMLWGSSFFFIALARDGLPPVTMAASRLVPAALILLAVIAWFGQRLPATLTEWGKFLVFAIFNNVLPFVLIIHAQRDVTGGMASVFNATAPLFTVFLSAYFIPEERLSWRRVGGILIGILGVALLIGLDSASTRNATAPLLLLGAAACYGVSNVYARRILGGYQPFALAAAQMLASLVLATIAAALLEAPWTLAMPPPHTIWAVIGMGTFGSAFAALCHFTVLRRAGATNAMLVTIILPLTPFLLGAIFLGDTITSREVIGALVIASGLLVIDGRLLSIFRKRVKHTP